MSGPWGPTRALPRPSICRVFLVVGILGRSVAAWAGDEEADSQNEAAPGDVKIDIDEAVRRATELSPVVRRAVAERRVVEARRIEAELLLPANPVASVAVGRSRVGVGGPGGSASTALDLQVEQTVEVAGQRGTRQAVVAGAVQVAVARERLARAEARARAQATYVAVLLATAQQEWAARRQELAGRLVDSMRARADSGASSDVDLRLAIVEHSRTRSDLVAATQGLGDALADLRVLLGVGPQGRLSLTTPLRLPELALPSLAQAVAQAQQRRAELSALDARRSELDAEVVRLRREAIPSPMLFLGLQRDRPGEEIVRGGVAIPLPLWRRNQGPLALVRAEQQRTTDERTLVERELIRDVDVALRAVVSRGEQVRLVQSEMVPAAEAALELLTQGWRAGKFDVFRMIQASREAGDAQRRALEDLGRFWQARIELDRAMGVP
jgi:cobalt-zinc-cadmium efflux system outer membrane protein